MHISDYFTDYDSLIDTHCHLMSEDYDKDRVEVVKRAQEQDIKVIFDIGVNLETSKLAIHNSKIYEGKVLPFIGVDPEVFEPGSPLFEDLEKDETWFETQYMELEKLIGENPELITGIGETGMDFHHFKTESPEVIEKSNAMQQKLFELHLDLAEKYKLPLSIHSRGAEKECLEIIKDRECMGIFHSYTGDYKTAVEILDCGWGLGVNGIVTFKNANDLRETYRKLLGEIPQAPEPHYFYKRGIFFETDGPFLSPEGKRGDRNEPANVKDIYESFVNMLLKRD